MKYTLPSSCEISHFGDGGTWVKYHGRPVRSVSRILDRIWPLPPDLDPYYLERGRIVHHATTLIDAATLDWESVDPRIKPFLDAYVSFKMMAGPVVEASELTVVHPSYKFGARLDRVYRLPGQDRLVVTDIKCGTGKEDRYWCQVAACAIALDDAHVGDYDIALLNLDKTGRPHFTVAEDPGSWVNRFRDILEKDSA
jgi:hypothetical protein